MRSICVYIDTCIIRIGGEKLLLLRGVNRGWIKKKKKHYFGISFRHCFRIKGLRRVDMCLLGQKGSKS